MAERQTQEKKVECRISANAGGKAHIRASLHVRTATFDDEKWKLITLMCSHMTSYDALFAPSCGSVGDFTDIKQDAEGNLAITSEMQCYSFSVRRLNGEFYAHVYPFDTKFFRKVHPAGALLFSGVHSHLILLQHLPIHLPTAKKHYGFSQRCPNIGWRTMVLCVWMRHIDGNHQTQLQGFGLMASTLSPIPSRPKLGILFTMEPEAELPMIHHLAFDD